MDNLLKEAIADAKKVQEIAMENAKVMLTEAFKPQLESMVSQRLKEAGELAEDNDATSGIGSGLTVDEPAPKKPSAATSKSSHIENPGLEIDDFGEGNTHKKPLKEAGFGAPPEGEDELGLDLDLDGSPDVGLDVPGAGGPPGAGAPPAGLGAPAAAPVAPTGPAAGAGMGAPGGAPDMGMGAPGAGLDGGMGGDPDELDLDAIIAQLELDVPGDEMGEPKFEAFSDAMAGSKKNGPLDGAVPGAIKEEAEGVHTDGKSPKAVEGVNGGKKVTPGQEVKGSKEGITEAEEFNLDEMLREMEVEEQAKVSEAEQITAENVQLKKSLREHRAVVQFLKDRINEVNMLNAKLLYTNKLFKSFDLNGTQKMRVVETFDRATTPREVKLVYTTLAESLKAGASSSKKSVKAITEGIASKAMTSTAPKSPAATQTILAEGDDMVARMQKLAGIKKV
jgi:hypothetical protein